MKCYFVFNQEWESFESLYVGIDQNEANIALKSGSSPHNNQMEVWEDGNWIQTIKGEYKPETL